MPVIENSTYKKAPAWLPGGHAQSIYPTLFRKVAPPAFQSYRIETPDDDFIDLDLTRTRPDNDKLVVLSHGMEGNNRRKYIWGMVNAFAREGWDALAWNYRSCGQEPNRRSRLYHCADLDDIRAIINYALSLGYKRIILCGFSMGGNITLNYLGNFADDMPDEILGGITFSVPCDLTACSIKLDSGFNKVYVWNFLLTLRRKVRLKHAQMPDVYDIDGLSDVKTLRDFDNRYTAPIHGFLSAEDYWDKASCMHVLDKITRPVLLVNAKNDPFLAPSCFPVEAAEKSGHLYLEMPQEGGHVGFISPGPMYWSERRALEFAGTHLNV